MKHFYIALDLGASHGRIFLATINQEVLDTEIIHHFETKTLIKEKQLHWDFADILKQIKIGFKKCCDKIQDRSAKIYVGINSWGLDYGYIDKKTNKILPPTCYRDLSNATKQQNFPLSPQQLFETSGINNFAFNSIYRMDKDKSRIKDFDHYQMLFLPNLIYYYLTGDVKNEYSIATTSAFISHQNKGYITDIKNIIGFQDQQLPPLVYPGEYAGVLKLEWQQQWELPPLEFIYVNTHDTASAFNSIINNNDQQLGLVIGTWMILGNITNTPLLGNKAFAAGITNEGINNSKFLSQMLIPGLFIIQKLKAQLNRIMNGNFDYTTMQEEAKTSYTSVTVDLSDPALFNPKDIVQVIKKLTGINTLTTADLIKIAYNSVVNEIIKALIKWRELKPLAPELVITGGGIQDDYLLGLVKKAVRKSFKQIKISYIESTIVGNLKTQIMKSQNWSEITWQSLKIRI